MKLIWTWTLLLLVFLPCQVMAEDITSRDFATGYYLKVTKNKGPLYSLELPEEVYRTVQSADLSDLRVFNAAGEVVPHSVRRIKSDPATLRDREKIPYFPLYRGDDSVKGGGISLQVSRDASGAVVNIQPEQLLESVEGGERSGEVPVSRKLIGYLLDLSHLAKPVSRLDFQWQKGLDSSVYPVKIQQSSDLIHWRSLVSSATLADLQFGGQRVEQKSIELPRQPMKYLKLTWLESHWPLELTEVTGFSEIIETKKKYNWLTLYGRSSEINQKDKNAGDLQFVFNTDFRLPVSRLQVRFSGENSMARLLLQSRGTEDGQWQNRCEQVFYDLYVEEAALKNESCRTLPTTDKFWRIVVKEDGAGLGAGNSSRSSITLQLGWQPSELFFIGRGSPPFLLAFGSGKLAGQKQQAGGEMLLQTLEKETKGKGQLAGVARIDKKIRLSGDVALEPPVTPPPWKKWLLWLVLIMGVGLLAFMARSLSKEMKGREEKQEKKVSEEG